MKPRKYQTSESKETGSVSVTQVMAREVANLGYDMVGFKDGHKIEIHRLHSF